MKLDRDTERETKRILRKELHEQKKIDHKEKRRERRESAPHRSRRKRSDSKMSGFCKCFLSYLFAVFHIILDKIISLVLESFWGAKTKCPPIIGESYLTKSAVELARMIKEKELKSEELVRAYIERIHQTNPTLNFVTDEPFEAAINEAQQIDIRLSQGLISDEELSEKPFLGVPFTAKDSTAVKDCLYTLGIKSRRKTKAKEDAECVRLVKNAGAVIIALTNVPEINRWQETRNNVFGQTNNPYDVRRTVGGSSGGEAAAVASCSTAFGLGTDIGGSIRMPAFFCGIYGHMTTNNIVNTRGCTLRTGNERSTMVTVGPMTRHVEDLLPLLKVLAGPEKSIPLKLDEPVDIKKLKYYYIPESGEWRNSPISSELKTAMNDVISHFRTESDHPVQCIKLPGTEYEYKMWRYWMTQEEANFSTLLGNGTKLNPIVEFFKKLIGKSDYTLGSIYSLIDTMLLPKEKEKFIKEITIKCEDALNEILGDDGILFYHSAPDTALFHYHPLIKMYNFSYWCLFNVLRVPVTQIPLGLDSKGLPLGIQIVATKNRDRHCIAVANEIKSVFGGWVPPF